MALSDFLLNSDYPLDKVIYQDIRSVAIPGYDYNDVTFAHGLGFLPLVSAQWSTASDFSVSYNIGGGPNTGATRSYATGIAADGTNIYLTTSNNTASAVTLYFRIYGLMPDNVNADVPSTASSGDTFILNTDYNYSKLVTAGRVTGPGSGTSTSTITHALGYRPQVSIWMTRASRVSPYLLNQVTATPFDAVTAHVTTTALVFTFTSVLEAYEMHYRIYGDAA